MEINNKILISLLLGIGTCLTTASILAIVRELENVNERINCIAKSQDICWTAHCSLDSNLNNRLISVEEKLNTKTKKSK